MKTAIIAALMLFATLVMAQDRKPIKVTGSETVTKVVIVHAEIDGKQVELACNDGMSGCKALANGTYSMEILPENHGMYECKNIEVYRQEKLVGSYCLVEK